jgi:hypothetical protein
MKNTSKSNTVLLIIIVILLGVGIWVLTSKKDTSENTIYDFPTSEDLKPKKEVVEVQPEQKNIQTTTSASNNQTYTYRNHGFTLELPNRIVPYDSQSEGGPVTIIAYENKDGGTIRTSILGWVISNKAFYEEIGGYCSGLFGRADSQTNTTKKIGSTTFKVLSCSDSEGYEDTYYLFEQGKLAYIFPPAYGGYEGVPDNEYAFLKTFKFVGWN